MRIEYVDITNFRGIAKAKIEFNSHTVLIGDNNAGKSTVFEAIDLVLGPDRLSRLPVIDEHDFFNGRYFVEEGDNPKIEIELVITELEPDQHNRFKNHTEFWDKDSKIILQPGSIDEVDLPHIVPALRVKFVGYYNVDDDDFSGETFFCWPIN
ncbi:AAA family ATPase, partial [Parapusillimonas sp. SGNA-6]|nr:AAA family ATPase [Parapusillimonas sp. SGNA-6]